MKGRGKQIWSAPRWDRSAVKLSTTGQGRETDAGQHSGATEIEGGKVIYTPWATLKLRRHATEVQEHTLRCSITSERRNQDEKEKKLRCREPTFKDKS